MGRLYRKKDPSQKKKIKPGDDQQSAESGSESAGSSAAVPPTIGPAKENQQKLTTVKKTITGSTSLKINNKYVDQAMQFLREVKVELKKVAWPSRKQAMGSTIVVIMLVLLVSFFLGVVDIGLSSLIKAVLS